MECFGRCPLPLLSRTRRAVPSTGSTYRAVRQAKQSNQIIPTPVVGLVTGNGFTFPAGDDHVLSLTDLHSNAKFIRRERLTVLDRAVPRGSSSDCAASVPARRDG
jgi:hypothetical protein